MSLLGEVQRLCRIDATVYPWTGTDDFTDARFGDARQIKCWISFGDSLLRSEREEDIARTEVYTPGDIDVAVRSDFEHDSLRRPITQIERIPDLDGNIVVSILTLGEPKR